MFMVCTIKGLLGLTYLRRLFDRGYCGILFSSMHEKSRWYGYLCFFALLVHIFRSFNFIF
nr:MAG TPA: hypothetical protein [Caudoviricetes sp.]